MLTYKFYNPSAQVTVEVNALNRVDAWFELQNTAEFKAARTKEHPLDALGEWTTVDKLEEFIAEHADNAVEYHEMMGLLKNHCECDGASDPENYGEMKYEECSNCKAKRKA